VVKYNIYTFLYRPTLFFIIAYKSDPLTDVHVLKKCKMWNHSRKCLLGVRIQYFHISTLKNPIFRVRIMQSLWQIHVRITARWIEL